MKAAELIERLQNYLDFDIECKIHVKIPDEDLKGMNYPYPYSNVSVELDLDDIGHSEKVILLGCTALGF